MVSSAVPAAATRTTSFKGTSPSSKYVKLNVGGALYYTTMQTLTKQDTMLKAMFSGRMEVLTDSEGEPALRVLGPSVPEGFILVRTANMDGRVLPQVPVSGRAQHYHSVQGALRVAGRPGLVWGLC